MGKKKGRRSTSSQDEVDGAGPADPEPAAGAGAPATADPKAIKKFIDDVTLETVERWGVEEVIQEFLPNIALADPLTVEVFASHNITGAVLLHMNKIDIDDLGLSFNGMDPMPAPMMGSGRNLLRLGDRQYLWDMLQLIQKKRRMRDRTKVIWEIAVPTGGLQYYNSCIECLKYKCLPCCMPFDAYKLTEGSLEVDLRPPKSCGACCIPNEMSVKDLRFLKDVDTMVHCGKAPFCCLRKKGMHVIFHQTRGKDAPALAEDDGGDGVDDGDEFGPGADEAEAYETDMARESFMIWHPEMTDSKAEEVLALWAELRLTGN